MIAQSPQTRLKPRLAQRGFVMLDVMIGAFIGLIIVAAATKIYVENVKANNESLMSSKLNQELNAILYLVLRDVRRAGFYGADPTLDDFSQNPFTTGFNDLTVSQKTGEAAGSCVLYSYDRNADGRIGVSPGVAVAAPFDSAPYNIANVEQYGFRLNAGNLEKREGLAPGDIDVSCDNGVWTRVNSNVVNITAINFDLASDCFNVAISGPCFVSDPAQIIRSMTLSLSASMPNSSRSAAAFTKIRNDKYVASYP